MTQKVRLGVLFTDMRAEVVNVSARRRKAFIPVIGREGDIQQDLGSSSRRIVIKGSLYAQPGMIPPIVGIFGGVAAQTITSVMNSVIGASLRMPDPHPILIQQYIEMLWRLKLPIPLMCDVVIALVTIDDMQWQQQANEPNVYHYNIILTEYIATPVAVRNVLSLAGAGADASLRGGGFG